MPTDSRSVCCYTVPASILGRLACGLLHDQMVVRRRGNANIHGDNREEATPSAVRTVNVWCPLQPSVDSLEACLFMLNQMSNGRASFRSLILMGVHPKVS